MNRDDIIGMLITIVIIVLFFTGLYVFINGLGASQHERKLEIIECTQEQKK